jgi:hypothetical protein
MKGRENRPSANGRNGLGGSQVKYRPEFVVKMSGEIQVEQISVFPILFQNQSDDGLVGSVHPLWF